MHRARKKSWRGLPGKVLREGIGKEKLAGEFETKRDPVIVTDAFSFGGALEGASVRKGLARLAQRTWKNQAGVWRLSVFKVLGEDGEKPIMGRR